MPDPLRLGAIPGATPDKWVSRWRQRYPHLALSVEYFDDDGQLDRIVAGTVDVGYFRCREDADGLDKDTFHRVLLYREDPVVCAAADHWIAASEESVAWEELGDETFLDPGDMFEGGVAEIPQRQEAATPEDSARDIQSPRSGSELAGAERMALEVAASGAGVVVLPSSTARMLSRKDIVIRTVDGLPGYDTGLAWLREQDSDLIQEFIGVARGRKPGSGRSAVHESRERVSRQKPRRAKDSSGPGRGPRRPKRQGARRR